MKYRYIASCAAVALLSGSTGLAHAADAAAAASADTSSTAVQEVIVTATRRNESIEKVPLTIQAMTGETLQKQNIATLDDLLKYTPNVTFAQNGPGSGNIFMRGLSAGFDGGQSSAAKDTFPNVAIYLDDESMQFPSRNVDIYMADMDRVEVLEGPQGTLFGGGAEAGAVRYITNKPNLDHYEAKVEGQYGFTAHGDDNTAVQAMINIPIVQDKLAIRLVVYDERQGGYIDNVLSTFNRSNNDLGNFYFGLKPGANGLCPNGKPAGTVGTSTGYCALPASSAPSATNQSVAANDQNPVTYTGGRASVLWQINPDWDVLITETLQHLDAEGTWSQEPVGLNFQPLAPLQETSFAPAWNKDNWDNTAWTVNGKAGPLKLVYTGGYLDRHISQQADYTGYSRSIGGMYYQCTGGSTGWGTAAPVCYSPVAYWNDTVHTTHLTQEIRVSSPDTWRLRFIAGGYFEQFRIYDVMNFDYKSIPSCSPENLAEALAGGPVCVANVVPSPGSTILDPSIRGDNTAFGEDESRGYDQYAVFASADFDIIPNVLTISGGTRWYEYNEFEVGSVYQTGTGCLNVPNGCFADNVNIDSHDDRVTYTGFKSRANITWKITPDIMTYFTFSQGFRPGGFNRKDDKGVAPGADGISQLLTPNSYAPDSLTNYEIGMKGQFLDHRLLLNLSAYYMDWDNVQLLLFNPTELGNTTFAANGPSYNIKGVEAQFTARVTEGLTLDGSASYNNATQSNSPCLISNNPASATYGQCITEVVPKGSTTPVPFENPFGVSGTTPAFSPAFQGNIRARYEWNINEYKAHVQVGGNYVGGMWSQPATYSLGDAPPNNIIPTTTLLRYYQPAYGTLDAAIGIAKDKWYAEIYGTNLLDSNASLFTSSAQFIKSEVPLRPRVVMIKIGASF